ncbi:unnamed protein product [Dicrocoelium dendriticum]|nr:unnamed protein product [Dicrocoelium dendriticum]
MAESCINPQPSRPSVLVYDAAAKNAVFTHTVSSSVPVVESEAIVHSVMPTTETQNDENQPLPIQSAALAAVTETERMAVEQREHNLQACENRIKAEVRGQQAMKRERVRRHYQILMSRLDELARDDVSRRRRCVVSDPDGVIPGAPGDPSIFTRRLEKIFENEVLHQLSSVVQPDGLLPTSNSIERAVEQSRLAGITYAASAFKEDFSSDICHKESTKRPYIMGTDILAEGDGNASTVHPATPNANSNALIQPPLVHDIVGQGLQKSDGHFDLRKERTEITADSAGGILNLSAPAFLGSTQPPKSSVEKEVAVPFSTSIVVESALGPGERPFLPSLRRSRLLCGPPRGTNQTTQLTHSPSPLIGSERDEQKEESLCLSSTYSTPFSDRDSVRSVDGVSAPSDLEKQQLALDQELASIDSRLSYLKLAAAMDMDVPRPLTSFVCSTSITSDTVSQPPLSAITQLTPRGKCVVEGYSADDHAVCSSSPAQSKRSPGSEASPSEPAHDVCVSEVKPKPTASQHTSIPLLTDLPQTCIDRLSALVRNQITSSHYVARSQNGFLDSTTSFSAAPITDRSTASDGASVTRGSQSESVVSLVLSSTSTPLEAIDTPQETKSYAMVEFEAASSIASSIVTECPDPSSSTSAVQSSLVTLTLPDSETVDTHSNVSDSTDHESGLSIPHISPKPLSLGPPEEELRVLRSVTRLANRLAHAAIVEATTELNMRLPEEPCLPPQPEAQSSVAALPLQQSSLVSSSSLSSAQHTGPDGLDTFSSSDSFKAELRAALTSSLITSLIGQSSDSTGLTAGSSSLSELLKQFLSSRSHHDFTSSGLDTKSNLLSHATEHPSMTTVSMAQLMSASSPSSISANKSDQADLETVSTKSSTIARSSVTRTQADRDRFHGTFTESTIKQMKQRILKDYLRVNKDWLLSLAGQNSSRNSGRSSSVASTADSDTTSSPVFRHLSPGDSVALGSSDSSSPTPSASMLDLIPSSQDMRECHSDPTRPLTLSFSTHPHSTIFKPLPRLEEATSEESIAAQSEQLTVVESAVGRDRGDPNISQTPSNSYSDSRKSSEFFALSLSSASNSNFDSGTKVDSGASVQNGSSKLNASSSNADVASDATTLHRLRTDLPATPIEPSESEVVSCLGSNMSSASSTHHPDSIVRELLEGGEESFCLHNLPPMIRSPPSDRPALTAVHTRTTTTIDSSLVWDDADTRAAGTKDALDSTTPSRTQGAIPPGSFFSNLTTTSKSPGSEGNVANEPRPSTPAEGALTPTPHQRIFKSTPGDRAPFQSMPTIYVDCASETPTDVYHPHSPTMSKRKHTLYASWSNFTRKPPLGHAQPSPSESLLSFQHHEASCLFLSDPQVNIHPLRKDQRSQDHQFPQGRFDHVNMVTIMNNTHATRSVINRQETRGVFQPSGPHGRGQQSNVSIPKWASDPSKSTCPETVDPAPTNSRKRPKVPHRRQQTVPVAGTSNTKVQSRHASGPCHDRVSRLVEAVHVRRTAQYHDTSCIAVSQQANTTLSPPERPSRAAHNAMTASGRQTYLMQPPNIKTESGSLPGALLASDSLSVQQSLSEQLSRWRADRLGFRHTSRPKSIFRGSYENLPCLPTPLGSIGHLSSADSAAAPPTRPTGCSSSGPSFLPFIVEPSFEDDMSSTTLLVNEISLPPTLEPRPFTPTPGERPSTDSEDLNTHTPPLLTITGQDVLTGTSARPPAACAGDEVSFGRQRVHIGVRFSDQIRVEQSYVGPAAYSASLSTTQELDAIRARPSVSTIRAPRGAERAHSRSHHSSRQTSTKPTNQPDRVLSERQQRVNQAQLNRLRMKEFDRLRRERSLRRTRKRVAR